MTDEQDRVWSREVAELAVDGLVTAKIVSQADFERAVEIVSEEIHARLAMNHRPENQRLKAS